MTESVKPFLAYNVKVLADNFNIAAQMQARIESLVVEGKTVADLPDSIVPTDTLYALIICYSVMYKLLLDDHLIKSGNSKHSSTTIH